MPRSSVTTKRGGSTKRPVKKVATKKTTRKKTPIKKASAVLIKQASKKVQKTDGIKRNPLGHLLLEKMLREAGFRGGISTKKELLEAYSYDESIFQLDRKSLSNPRTVKT